MKNCSMKILELECRTKQKVQWLEVSNLKNVDSRKKLITIEETFVQGTKLQEINVTLSFPLPQLLT